MNYKITVCCAAVYIARCVRRRKYIWGVSSVRKLVCLLLLIGLLAWPATGLAMGFRVSFNFMRQDDGTTVGELFYNDQIVWRVALLADGARPVVAGSGAQTTSITPDVSNGLFLLRVQ